MDTLPLVNRCAIAITPNPPFWEWVNQLIPETSGTPISNKEFGDTVYLLPDYEDEDDIIQAMKKYVKKNYAAIFLNELEAWSFDPDTYPVINYELFEQWFSISYHTMIFDLLTKPLKRD